MKSHILITRVSEKENKKGELIQVSKGILRIFHKLLSFYLNLNFI